MEELIQAQEGLIDANKRTIEADKKATAVMQEFSDMTLAQEIATAALRLSCISYVPPMVIVTAIISVMPQSGRDQRRLKLLKQETERIVRERQSGAEE